jgi:3-oxoacyl-[acyl-carrier protein] reductase
MISIDLSGKLALITGASGQLGRVMARTIAQAGANVALHYHRDETNVAKVCAELKAIGVKAEIFQADITKLEEVLLMQKRIQSSLGNPDIIVNNAVIQYEWTTVLDQSIEDYESQFRSCVLQNVNMAKAFVPAMKEKNYGRVIGINTECSMQNMPTQSAYVSGKRGMDGVLRVLAREVGMHNITVNQVAPGWTISEKDRVSDPVGRTHSVPNYISHVALGRRGEDQEIANAVLFLASDLASFITGAYLPVCGGFVMPAI